ncbi:MAG: hypothetical protein HY579_08920 [Nitrospinae bacterium]|nr:hypothetical protein [Nitrospinota bacterium]
MRKMKVVRRAEQGGGAGGEGLRRCPVAMTTLSTGEIVKRGCGEKGLERVAAGWRCFYCGNYIYLQRPDLRELWSHFKTGREYWRTLRVAGQEFVNGILVYGDAQGLPAGLTADLVEILPPGWFAYYLVCDEKQFDRYLDQRAAGPNGLDPDGEHASSRAIGAGPSRSGAVPGQRAAHSPWEAGRR